MEKFIYKKLKQMKKTVLLTVLSLVFLWNCAEMPDMSSPKDSIAPGQITNTNVLNINGGVIITYSLPEDDDLLGVKAIYQLKEDGEELQMFSSAYRDTIEINGFPDTKERSVSLFCIDKSYNESNSVEVKIKPLTPPIELIRESLQVNPSFGGIFSSWKNEYKENIAVTLLVEDSLGFMIPDDTHYSATEKGEFSFRGFEPIETHFRIEMRDRWGNFSEPLDFTITPFYEEEILPFDPAHPLTPLWDIAYGAFDGTRAWRGDFLSLYVPGWNNIWSGARHTWGIIVDGKAVVTSNMWGTFYKPRLSHYFPDANEDLTYFHPTYFIFDLKNKIIPSRFKFWPYTMGETFPNKIEVWGTNDTPKGGPGDFETMTESLNYWTEWNAPPYVEGTDAWKDDWIKLGDIQVRPTPSGAYHDSDLTPEDIERRNRGYEIEVYPDVIGTVVRYLRFIYIDVSHEQCYTAEIKIWGQYTDDK
ncbi:MAG: DUF5126 domain-containing protein [Proteiniphilum sp.]